MPQIRGSDLHANDNIVRFYQLAGSFLPQDMQLKVSYRIIFKYLIFFFVSRLNCQDSCNKAYFPSLFCGKIEDVEIHLNGNVFNNFYKYPDPEYVMDHESAEESDDDD